MDLIIFRDQLSKGKWLPESRMVNLVCHTGKFWHYMGAEADIGRCLYPEEALYLIDTVRGELGLCNYPLGSLKYGKTSIQH